MSFFIFIFKVKSKTILSTVSGYKAWWLIIRHRQFDTRVKHEIREFLGCFFFPGNPYSLKIVFTVLFDVFFDLEKSVKIETLEKMWHETQTNIDKEEHKP